MELDPDVPHPCQFMDRGATPQNSLRPGFNLFGSGRRTRGVKGFAILLGFQSENNSIELKRIVVSVPNRRVGRKLLEVAAHKVFTEHHAHRLWLDVFPTNDRARHVYKTFGFREEGQLREAVRRDGSYHSLILMSMLEDEYRASSHFPDAREI